MNVVNFKKKMVTLFDLDDMKVINAILQDDEMYERTSEDGQGRHLDRATFNPLCTWLGIDTPDGLAGCFLYHPVNLSTAHIHAHILKPYREQYSFGAGKALIEYFVEDQYDKLITEVPEIYKDVYYFCKKMGFQCEGINRLSIRKKGKLLDQFRMGITRKEAESWLLGQQ